MAYRWRRFPQWLRALLLVLCGFGLAFGLGLGHAQPAQVPPLAQLGAVSQPSVQNQAALDSPQQLLEQGKQRYQSGQFAEAITLIQKAAAAYQALGDRPSQATALNHLALAHQKLAQWPQAEAALQQSLQLVEQLSDAQQKLPILAQALNHQGNVQLAQGKTEAALTTWQRAAQVYAQAGDEAGQVGSLINQAQAQQALGFYLQARKSLDQVKATLEQQPDLALRATGLRSLGNVLRLVGAWQPSEEALVASLEAAQMLGSPEAISTTHLSLGNTARGQAQTSKALDHYQAAAQSTLPLTRVQAQLNQLSLLVEQNRTAQAQALWPQIEAALAPLPESRMAVDGRMNLAQTLIKLKQQSAAATPSWVQIARLIGPAVRQAESLGDPQAQSYAIGGLAQVYEQTQQWSDAKQLTQQALALAQAVNASEMSYQWQWQLGRIFKAQGDLAAATIAYRDAFQTLQSLRRDLVAVHPDIQFGFKERVEPVYRGFVDLLLQQSTALSAISASQPIASTTPILTALDTPIAPQAVATAASASTQGYLQEARAVLEALQAVELENFFRSACLEGRQVAIDQVQQADVAALYPIVLDDRLEVILSLPQQPLQRYAIPVAQSTVEDTVKQLRFYLEKPYTAPEGKVLGKTVYDWLIQPAIATLDQNQIKTLVFVLDGPFRNLPMAALYDGDRYLVERYSLALAPGLQLLNPRPLSVQNLKVLAAGLTQARDGFPALDSVRSELEQIQATVTSQVLLDERFTQQTLRSQMQESSFPVVHLATHGQFSSSADQTFILTWDQRINVNELSDLLRSSEQIRPQPIELLVLSACETALGDQRATLGLAGVAIQSGARSTLASLWTVEDRAATQLMSEFYRQFRHGDSKNKAEALQQAQIALLKDPNYRSPVHWAPYILLGNWL
ncbi:MAG: CHAT domain-containing protein [Thermosynechococcaceae cyanobacterium]